eukprot:UN33117
MLKGATSDIQSEWKFSLKKHMISVISSQYGAHSAEEILNLLQCSENESASLNFDISEHYIKEGKK